MNAYVCVRLRPWCDVADAASVSVGQSMPHAMIDGRGRRALNQSMRKTCFVMVTVVSGVLMGAACGSDSGDDGDAEPFDTFAACFDDHHVDEALPTGEAIVICCLDHPIGDAGANVVCGEDAVACEAYVAAQLGADATTTEVTDACADYIVQRSQ